MKAHNYICEKPKQPVNKIDTDCIGCPEGWLCQENRCYAFHQDPTDWNTAKKRCGGKVMENRFILEQ